MTIISRRQHERVPLLCEITATVLNNDEEDEEFVIRGSTASISEGGIFFTSKLLLLKENTRLRLMFIMPGSTQPITVEGTVRHLYKREDKSIDEYNPGMGISFDTISEPDLQRIRMFVRNRTTG
ncbi:MAG: hypothetical protein A2284_03960 [Deltaproteobacteria bacterium RIFOXYA12_FULL_61_11]|nr:MAG: hypothetical protein A2284_03960 [Deltaproteobacteria bacterium RIFOXYA12_FULL_61_11]